MQTKENTIQGNFRDGQLSPGQIKARDVYTNEFNKREATASR